MLPQVILLQVSNKNDVSSINSSTVINVHHSPNKEYSSTVINVHHSPNKEYSTCRVMEMF